MKFVIALNSISPQVWAFLILLTGCAAVLTFHKSGIDIGIAAGIIGAGVQMFTSSSKAQDHSSGNAQDHLQNPPTPPSAATTQK